MSSELVMGMEVLRAERWLDIQFGMVVSVYRQERRFASALSIG